MSNCTPPRSPFSSANIKQKESGFLATHKQDFLAHASGEAFRHCADQVNMNPSLTTILGDNVQDVLENIELLLTSGTGNGLFVSIGAGDGYAVGDYNVGLDGIASLEDAFAAAFVNPHVQSGGIIVLKTGVYSMTTTVSVPSGITIWGETGGVVINGRMNGIAPMFRVLSADPNGRFDLGGGVVASSSSKYTKLWNLVLVSNLNREVGLGLASAPMISIDDGAVCKIDRVSCFGQFVTGTNVTDLCAIGSNALVTTTNPTILEVENCVIDNFSCGVSFNPTVGNEDYLTVKNCRIRHTGTNATKEYKYGISTNYVNLDISNNFCFGENGAIFDSYGFIYIRSEVPTSINNVKINVNENSGGLGTSANQQELLNLIDYSDFAWTGASSSNKFGSFDKNNSWGYCTGSTSLPIVVGFGGKGSFGDINGRLCLNFLLERYSINAANPAVNYSAPLIYLLPGDYVVNTNVGQTALSFEGIVQFKNGDYIYPNIYLNMTSGTYVDEFGKYTLSIAGYIKNVIVYSSSVTNSLTISQLDFSSYVLKFDTKVVIDSCKFYVPVNINFGGSLSVDGLLDLSDGYSFDKIIGYAKNCSFHKIYTSDSIGRSNTQQVYLKANTGTFSFEDCNFSGNSYALFVDGYTSAATNEGRYINVDNCKFDVRSGDTNIDGYALIDDFATAPSNWEPHYIYINIPDEKDSISFNNCHFNMVREKEAEDFYSYSPVSQALIEAYDPSAIYIKASNISITNCDGDGPDQARIGYNSQLYAFWHLNFKSRCFIDNCYFRGSFPMLITGTSISSSDGAFNFSNSPDLIVSNSKFRHYYRSHVLDINSFGTMALLNVFLPDWVNDYTTNSQLTYGPALVNINNCLFDQSVKYLPSSISEMRIPLSGISVTAYYSTVGIEAGGWGVKFINNTVLSNHPYISNYFASVYIRVSENLPSITNAWHSQFQIIGNEFTLNTVQQSTSNASFSVCLNVIGNKGIISNNIFNFINPNDAASSTDPNSVIGWLRGIINNYGVLNVSGNSFNRIGNIPQYGMTFLDGNGSRFNVSNNTFDQPYTNSLGNLGKKFINIYPLHGASDSNIYFDTVLPSKTYAMDTGSSIASDTDGDWGQIKIYRIK